MKLFSFLKNTIPVEESYVQKPIEMIRHAEALINPFNAGLYLVDRELLAFELSFFYYFVYDYKIFHKLDNQLRSKIFDVFLEKIQIITNGNFPDLELIEQH